MFFTIAMVVWRSALMNAVYAISLYFILSIPSLSWIHNEALYLWMRFVIMMPSCMVSTWSYLSSSLTHLPIVTWKFRTSPIKVSWYSQSILISSWSQWFHLRNQGIMSYPPLNDIYSGESSVKGTVRLVILNTSPFDILIPSDNILGNSEPILLGPEIFSPNSPGYMTTEGGNQNF